MVGEPLAKGREDDFINRMQVLLGEGADINAPHPGNDRVNKGETVLDYYLRRQQEHHAIAQQEKDDEGNTAAGEAVYANYATMAGKIAAFIQSKGGRERFEKTCTVPNNLNIRVTPVEVIPDGRLSLPMVN